MRREYILILFILISLIYGFFYFQRIQYFSFNWLSPPIPEELYITSCTSDGMSIHSSSSFSCQFCNRSINISVGENEIQNECGNLSLTCGDLTVRCEPPNATGDGITILSSRVNIEDGLAKIIVEGVGRSSGYKNLNISLDGEVVRSPIYHMDGRFLIIERIPIPEGRHEIKVEYGGMELLNTSLYRQMNIPLSSYIIILLIISFMIMRRSASSIISSFILLIIFLVLDFRFSQSNLSFLAPTLLLLILVRWRQPHLSLPLKEAMFSAMAFTIFILLINLSISSLDVWGAYYFRHAEETLMKGTTSYFDELSYLGREFTYPPIYFEFSAALSKVFLSDFESIRVPLNLFLSFLFATTSYLIFSNYERKQRFVAFSIFITQWGILLTASGIGLHMLAFSLMNIAVLLLHTSPILSSLSLAFSFSAHPLTLIMFPFFTLVHLKFSPSLRVAKRVILISVLAVFFSLPFYAPIFIRSGFPYEIVPSKWGLLLSYGPMGLMFDHQFLLPLFLLTIFFSLLQRRFMLQMLLLTFLLLFNAFVSLRADLIVAVVGAGLLPLLFKRHLSKEFLSVLLLFYILPNLFFGAVVLSGNPDYCTWGLANDMCLSPMRYIHKYIPNHESVVTDPIYGHLVTYIGRKPVLSDLYVEYADYEKWKAAEEFSEQGDTSIVEEYGISVFVVKGGNRSIKGLDRIYDNGFITIFRKKNKN